MQKVYAAASILGAKLQFSVPNRALDLTHTMLGNLNEKVPSFVNFFEKNRSFVAF